MMNGYNFTERVRKVLQIARQEAIALKHEYVGTEHILLGIMTEGEGVASAALDGLGINQVDLRDEVLRTVKPGSDSSLRQVDLPYTSRAKRVLELAMTSARSLNHSYVGTEHLILGLIREERGIAAQALTALGVTTATLQSEVLRLLGTGAPQPGGGLVDDRPLVRTPRERQAGITVIVEHHDGRIEKRKFQRPADAADFLSGLEF